MTGLYSNTDEHGIWQQLDLAFWRGELLSFDEGILSSKLTGADRDVATLILRAEACELDGSNPKYAQMVEKLGQSGPAAHSARAALAYAHHSFFIGAWQTCLDALHQAAVTALRCEEAKSRELRGLRAEA